MLEVILSNKFKKDWKIIKKRGYDLKKFEVVLEKLLRQEILSLIHISEPTRPY